MVPLPPLRDGARALPISSFRQSMPSFDTRCPGLHLQPGASVVLGCVGELPGSRCTDFNPRAPCGTRRERRQQRAPRPAISIHAPRVGRDRTMRKCGDTSRNFNPRAPCGARHIAAAPDHKHTQFQSTRPVWGATCCILRRHSLAPNFNPRAPCGTRRDRRAARCALHRISIHAPRVGRDALAPGVFTEGYISIHAPRVGRDLPSGGTAGQALTFQSTRPVWDATVFFPSGRLC